jgi:F0F1-type ATP synthase epsilon subunit
MARRLDFRVLNPAETLLEVQEVAWVHLRLVDGTGLTIYPGHAPLLAETVTAPLRYADDAGEHVFNAEAGILRVRRDEVSIFTRGESEAVAAPAPSAVSKERRFERLAQELRARLEEEPDSPLRKSLAISRDEQR